MAEMLQGTSSRSLQELQPEPGRRDPLSASQGPERADEGANVSSEDAGRDRFEDYLNQASISVLERNQPNVIFDAANQIEAEGTLLQPNQKTLI